MAHYKDSSIIFEHNEKVLAMRPQKHWQLARDILVDWLL